MIKILDAIIKVIVTFIKITIVLLLVGIGLNYYNKFASHNIKNKLLSLFLLLIYISIIPTRFLYFESPILDFSINTTIRLIKENIQYYEIAYGFVFVSMIFGITIASLSKSLLKNNIEIDDEGKYFLIPLYMSGISVFLLLISAGIALALKNEYIFINFLWFILSVTLLGLLGMFNELCLYIILGQEKDEIY